MTSTEEQPLAGRPGGDLPDDSSCNGDVQNGIVRLPLTGDLDLSSAHGPLEAAHRLLADQADRHIECVVVDLTDVRFIDSSGLGGLVQLSNYARAKSIRVELAGASRRVRSVLELSGLASVLPFSSVD